MFGTKGTKAAEPCDVGAEGHEGHERQVVGNSVRLVHEGNRTRTLGREAGVGGAAPQPEAPSWPAFPESLLLNFFF